MLCRRQTGRKIVAVLFSIYLNDLEYFLSEKGVTGVRRHVDESNLYLKLFILLYADDTAILSDNETDFRHALGSFKTYCDTWKLNINATKTKIIIFW